MVDGHRIEKRIDVDTFQNIMKNYTEKTIECSNHAFFRLNEKQRKIIKCDNLKKYLLNEIPIFAGIQYNKCHSAFYKYENKRFIRLVIEITLAKIDIVTFYIIDDNQLPKLK